jgi:hypothetical protein
MNKLSFIIASLGVTVFMNAAQATPGSSQCPASVSLGDLKQIIATPSDTTVNLAGSIWTVGAHSPIDFSQSIVLQEHPARNSNGKLECPYALYVGPEANPQQTIILTKSIEMVKQPF